MKKILIGAALLFTGLFANAQVTPLENIVVEKYYVSNAADAAGSTGVLPVGSVTYRIYADMAPGYNFQALFGLTGQPLTVTTSTTFFNNEDYGSTTPSTSAANVRKNSALLDSYFSVGGAAAGKMGVFKSEDTDGSPGNAQGILQNNDPSTTGPLNIGAAASLLAQDGMISGSPVGVTYVGISGVDLAALDGLSQAGNSFTTTVGSIAALGGAVGPTAANRVLIGQFTTDGIFHFELNAQIGGPGGTVFQYVAANPTGSQILAAFCTGTYGAPNILPVVNITAPTAGQSFVVGSIALAATATDADGTISQVEFKVDGVSVGIDATSPYTATYAGVIGNHTLQVIATDNNGGTSNTSVAFSCVSNPAPVATITSPATGSSFVTGATVVINATATDNGSVASLQFKIDGSNFGALQTGAGPYTINYTAVVGTHIITAVATDNLGLTGTSAPVSITVANNPPPVVSITAPTAGSSIITGSTYTISANASDNGSVAQVEFFVDGVSAGVDANSPYSVSATAGAIGTHCITATATDNIGATTTTVCTNINVVSSIAPYAIQTSSQTCIPTTFCVPVVAVAAVDNVIGYDVVLNYDATKVTPTGNITVYGDIVTASQVDAINNFAAGTMNISLFFNASAPATAEFNGTGRVFCVEFTKTGSFSPVDTASFSIASLQESYFTGVISQFVDAGKVTTYKDTTYTAGLRFWSDNSPLKYDPLNPATYLVTNIYGNDLSCSNQSATAVQPDLNGNFSYATSNGLAVNIQRDILGTTDVQPVINGADALLARKVLLNDISFIPNVYQAISMDVNADGVISAGDVSQINQRAVLSIPEFKQAWNYSNGGTSNGQPSKDWLFVDTVTVQTNAAYAISATYPANDGVGFSKAKVPVVTFCQPIKVLNLAICPEIFTTNYKGILLGDVNGNFATVGSGGVFRNAGTDKVVFDLSKAIFANGFVDVPVSAMSFDKVNALDFAVQFNGSNLSFNSMVSYNENMESLSHFNTDDKTLRFTSNSMESYNLSNSILAVRFATKNNSISKSDLTSVVGYLNGERVATEVIGANESASANISVFPNPAAGILNVAVSENAMVQLMDMEGRQVVLQTEVLANQKTELNVQTLANGVYMLKISNDNFVSMKKVVVKN